MAQTLKILGVHGLGDHRNTPWQTEWEAAVRKNFPAAETDVKLTFSFVTYDDIFAKTDLSMWQTMAAVGKLISSSVGEMFGARKRGLFDNVSHDLRWYAGYVVAWVENESFKKETRKRIYKALQEHQPDVLLAHSLGSLVTYNALTSPELKGAKVADVAKNLTYVTLGSQLGNPFVVGNLTPGRLSGLDSVVKQWRHLYNSEDDVFTAPIRLPSSTNFRQIETFFDIEGIADHSAPEYLSHGAAVDQLWRPLTQAATGTITRELKAPHGVATRDIKPRRRALLVGINDYPDPAAQLEGCVNDVFLMSSVLQECNFQPDQIRICLNDRATAAGIRERLEWLVSDARPNDELVFFYSGHGAQLPTYGDGDAVDHMDETLVPYDFDWTPQNCVIDDQIFQLYSQLPYETRLVMIFDCCHSGGIHRSGSRKSRGLEPPDDIRHRAMKWNSELAMWEPRDLNPVQRGFSTDKKAMRSFCGEKGWTKRLGRAMSLRNLNQKQYRALAAKNEKKPVGPYLPLILEACQEGELASEYRNGNESYGAFTFTLATALRQSKNISFQELTSTVGTRLSQLGYDQQPQILGPTSVVSAQIPWHGAAKNASRAKSLGAVKPAAKKPKKAVKK